MTWEEYKALKVGDLIFTIRSPWQRENSKGIHRLLDVRRVEKRQPKSIVVRPGGHSDRGVRMPQAMVVAVWFLTPAKARDAYVRAMKAEAARYRKRWIEAAADTGEVRALTVNNEMPKLRRLLDTVLK